MKRGAGFLALFAFLITGLHFASGPATMKEPSEVAAGENIAGPSHSRRRRTLPVTIWKVMASSRK